MANPTKYTPGYSYSGFQGANPTKPLPAPRVDDDFANISRSINEAIAALADIRRSDGRLKNGIVGPDTLSPTLKIGFTFRGLWIQGEQYVAGDGVVHEGVFYSALIPSIATEQNAPGDDTYWTELFSVDDLVVSGALSMPVNRFTGDGTQVEFDLDFTPVTAKNLLITIGGAPQETTQYATVGNKLTFSEPPPEGYSIEVRGFATLAVSDTLVSDTIIEGVTNLFLTPAGRTKLAALPDTIGGTGASILAMSQISDVRNFLDTAPYVATRTSLKAVDTTKETTCLLAEPGREGIFNWVAGDYAAAVAVDTAEGVYIKAAAVSASAGAWVRVLDNRVDPRWFGGIGDGDANDTNALKSAFAVAKILRAGVDLGDERRVWRVKNGQWPGYSGDERRTVILLDGYVSTVVGNGAKILFDGANSSEYATIFRLINGASLIRKGITLDYKNLPFSQGVCISKTANSARFTLDTATCGTPTWPTIERLCQYNFEPLTGEFCYGKTIFDVGVGVNRPITLVSPGVYDVDFSWGDTGALPWVEVGQTYVLYHKVNGYYFCDPTDGSLYSQDSWTHTVAGMSDAGSYVKDFIIHGGGVAPPPGSKRIISTTSDGVAHVNGCSGRFSVIPDLVEGTSDDAANLNCPFNDVSSVLSASSFIVSLFAPGRLPALGAKLWGVNEDGVMILLPGVVSTIGGNTIGMSQNLPAGFNTNWLIGEDAWITKNAVYAPKLAKRIAGGGAIIRGFNSTVRGKYVDINGPVYNSLCLWPAYNEGPVSKNVDVDVDFLRCGRGRDAVPAVVQYRAVKLNGDPAPAGAITGGRIVARGADSRPAVLITGGDDSAKIHIIESNCGYDQWVALPQPTSVSFLQNSYNTDFIHEHLGSVEVLVYGQGCIGVNTLGSKGVSFAGTGFISIQKDTTVSGGGNAADAGGATYYKTDFGPQNALPLAMAKGSLEGVQLSGAEQQGGWGVWTRPIGAAGQVLTRRFRVWANGLVEIVGSAWDGGHFKMGNAHIWLDANGDLHGKNTGAPTSDLDGFTFMRRTAAPASATSAGKAGDYANDNSYFYICVATNIWRRIAHATW